MIRDARILYRPFGAMMTHGTFHNLSASLRKQLVLIVSVSVEGSHFVLILLHDISQVCNTLGKSLYFVVTHMNV